VSSENLLTGERTLTGVSFATFVALDEEGNPTQVPAVIPETEEEIRLVESASERQKQRKNRKQNVQSFIKQYHIDKTI
jgi:acyl-CoA hydrolase